MVAFADNSDKRQSLSGRLKHTKETFSLAPLEKIALSVNVIAPMKNLFTNFAPCVILNQMIYK